jgi:hypothetical protein
MTTSDEYDDETETNLDDVLPATVLALLPGGQDQRGRPPLWAIIHPALLQPITVNPNVPLSLTIPELAALRQGYERFPALCYPLTAALADQSVLYEDAELIADNWHDMARGRTSAHVWEPRP